MVSIYAGLRPSQLVHVIVGTAHHIVIHNPEDLQYSASPLHHFHAEKAKKNTFGVMSNVQRQVICERCDSHRLKG